MEPTFSKDYRIYTLWSSIERIILYKSLLITEQKYRKTILALNKYLSVLDLNSG